MDILSYALARKYVADTANSLGSLKGAPCTIQNIEDNGTENIVTFKWTGTDGTEQTRIMRVKHGISITNIDVDENGYLNFTMSDGSTIISDTPISAETNGDSELEHDIVSNVAVGNASAGTTLPKGMTFTEYAEKVHVATLPPSVKINTPTSATHEIGEVITTLPISATITKGTYTLSKAQFYDGNTLLNTITGIPTNGVVSMNYSCNNNDTDMKIKVVATDSNGLTGNASVDIKYARGIFYGTSTTTDLYNTSALVRSLSKKELGKISGYKFTVDIPVGTKSVIIAIPSTMNLSAINFRESMGMDVLSTFNVSKVDVNGANGYDTISYNVYQYIGQAEFTQASHYDVTI